MANPVDLARKHVNTNNLLQLMLIGAGIYISTHPALAIWGPLLQVANAMLNPPSTKPTTEPPPAPVEP